MGCTHSARVFVTNPMVPGQDDAALEVFQLLGFKHNEINVLFSIFCDIDTHRTGSIRPIELFSYFGIDMGDLEKNLFMVFDEGKTGKMNFMEFVAAMWNFLSLPESMVGVVIYLMKDPSGTYCIKLAEVKELFEILHRKKVETSPVLQQIFGDFKQRYAVEISMHEFCQFVSANSSLSTPVVILQIKLRKQIIGESYWMRRAQSREKDPLQGQPSYVYKLHNILANVNEEHRKRMAEAKIKKQLSNQSDEERAALERQKSVLKKAFNLNASPSRAPSKKVSQSGLNTSTANSRENSVPALEASPSLGGAGNKRSSSNDLDSPVVGRPRRKSNSQIEAMGDNVALPDSSQKVKNRKGGAEVERTGSRKAARGNKKPSS